MSAGPKLTHIGASGEAHMVDVGDKAETVRTAIAEGSVAMQADTLAMILAAITPGRVDRSSSARLIGRTLPAIRGEDWGCGLIILQRGTARPRLLSQLPCGSRVVVGQPFAPRQGEGTRDVRCSRTFP